MPVNMQIDSWAAPRSTESDYKQARARNLHFHPARPQESGTRLGVTTTIVKGSSSRDPPSQRGVGVGAGAGGALPLKFFYWNVEAADA